jgi:hypothetical protein
MLANHLGDAGCFVAKGVPTNAWCHERTSSHARARSCPLGHTYSCRSLRNMKRFLDGDRYTKEGPQFMHTVCKLQHMSNVIAIQDQHTRSHTLLLVLRNNSVCLLCLLLRLLKQRRTNGIDQRRSVNRSLCECGNDLCTRHITTTTTPKLIDALGSTRTLVTCDIQRYRIIWPRSVALKCEKS